MAKLVSTVSLLWHEDGHLQTLTCTSNIGGAFRDTQAAECQMNECNTPQEQEWHNADLSQLSLGL